MSPAHFVYDPTPIRKWIQRHVCLLCPAGYVAYFIAACVLDFQRALALVVLTCLAVAAVSYEVASEHLGEKVSRAFKPVVRVFKRLYKWIKWWERERFSFWVDFSLELQIMRREWAPVSTVLSGFSFWLFWACWWRGSSWTQDTVLSSLSPLGVFACSLCLYSSCQHTGRRWVLPSVTEYLF